MFLPPEVKPTITAVTVTEDWRSAKLACSCLQRAHYTLDIYIYVQGVMWPYIYMHYTVRLPLHGMLGKSHFGGGGGGGGSRYYVDTYSMSFLFSSSFSSGALPVLVQVLFVQFYPLFLSVSLFVCLWLSVSVSLFRSQACYIKVQIWDIKEVLL